MAGFSDKALSASGSVTKGELDAQDRGEALRLLDGKGLRPVKLTESSGTPAPKPAAKGGRATAKQAATKRAAEAQRATTKKKADAADEAMPDGPVKLKRGEVVMFTEELSDMLAAGLQLEPALRAMESSPTAKRLPLNRLATTWSP